MMSPVEKALAYKEKLIAEALAKKKKLEERALKPRAANPALAAQKAEAARIIAEAKAEAARILGLNPEAEAFKRTPAYKTAQQLLTTNKPPEAGSQARLAWDLYAANPAASVADGIEAGLPAAVSGKQRARVNRFREFVKQGLYTPQGVITEAGQKIISDASARFRELEQGGGATPAPVPVPPRAPAPMPPVAPVQAPVPEDRLEPPPELVEIPQDEPMPPELADVPSTYGEKFDLEDYDVVDLGEFGNPDDKSW